MFHSYEHIFRERADAYQKAMELYPEARNREFELAVESAGVKTNEIICDAPAGGGYLRACVPESINSYLAVETAPDFTSHCLLNGNDRVIRSPLHQIDLDDNSVNVCINLAGSHHLEDKKQFFREAARLLKPGGRLVLADVEAGTNTDRFLNRFVDQNSSMGHQGVFLTAATADEIAACGFNIQFNELVRFPWSFESKQDMGVFCKLLFGIDRADTDTVIAAVEQINGFMPGPGKVNMAWELRYIVAQSF